MCLGLWRAEYEVVEEVNSHTVIEGVSQSSRVMVPTVLPRLLSPGFSVLDLQGNKEEKQWVVGDLGPLRRIKKRGEVD